MNARYFFRILAITCFLLLGITTAVKREDHKMPKKVCIVGSGNWGTCVARRVALNILDLKDDADKEELATEHKHASQMPTRFDEEVRMYVYEELYEGRKLSELINEQHENIKYLPGVKLPKEVVAVPDLIEACASADILMFVTPHQFLAGTLKQLKGHVKSDVIAVSLIKGLDVGTTGPVLLSSMIKSELSLTNDVVVVMGANVAPEVAEDQFVEITVASRDLTVAQPIVELLESPCFRSSTCTDVVTVEIFGALKNVIALGAGFCDALELGCSTKAAVMRRGMTEMLDFCKEIAGESFQSNTILQSAGVADVIATCFGGRNRRCAAAFGRKLLELESSPEGANPVTTEMVQKLWSDIETTELKGQKMQGVLTAGELMACLQSMNLDQLPQVDGSSQGHTESYAHYIRFNEHRKMLTKKTGKGGAGVGSLSPGLRFGLFTRIHAISHLGASPLTLFDW